MSNLRAMEPAAPLAKYRPERSLYVEGDALYQAMLSAIAGARRRVCLETYIFAWDEVGQRFGAALMERARAGVRTHLLVDGFGSLGLLPRRAQAELAEAGVRVRRFHRWQWRDPWRYNRRDHRKLLVVDGRTMFLGGFNIHRQSSLAAYGPQRWRDTHLEMNGPAAAQAELLFDVFWRYRRGREAAMRRLGSHLLVSNHNRRGRRALLRVINGLLGSARHRAWISTPYFVPDRRLQTRLLTAARRGVDVRLLVPGKSDVALARWASHAAYARLLEGGVRIFEYQARVLHAKTMVVDARRCWIGTANLDYRSLRHNYEITLRSSDRDLAQSLESQFEADLGDALEVKHAVWSRRHGLHYLAETIGWLARRWL